MAYVKLFESILASTIWAEPSDTRIVWVTMLAMADRDGIVQASVPGLAHFARVTEEQCELAIASFLAPDAKSRTKDFDGRRIEPVEGGWLVLNYEAYRDRASMDEKREKDRLRQERKRVRDASRSVTVGHAESRIVASQKKAQKHPQPEHTPKQAGPASLVPECDTVPDAVPVPDLPRTGPSVAGAIASRIAQDLARARGGLSGQGKERSGLGGGKAAVEVAS